MPSSLYQSQHSVLSLADLTEFARSLASELRPRDLVALDGNLGAGKTTLVQQLGIALGVKETVNSPTFVLMNEYRSGPYPVAHVDLYRLGPENAEGFADEIYTLLDEGKSLVLVEWACYGDFLKDDITLSIRLEHDPVKSNTRLITVTSKRPLNLSYPSISPNPELNIEDSHA